MNLSTLKSSFPKKRIDSARSNTSISSIRSIQSVRGNVYTAINTVKDDDNISVKSNSSIKSRFNTRNSLKIKLITEQNSKITDE